MRFTRVHGLILVNVALLGALALVSLSPRAQAQDRRRSNYLLASGFSKNDSAEALWIVDQGNQEVIAVTWDSNRNELVGIGYRDLNADAGVLRRGRSN
ncbi:MAG: hypothetical protein KDA22_11130 [Phycisphaerales bacterium]|nr:hypothetical protein [Phycisphaerales bacterium]